jgi:hypothetical protein
MHKPSLKNYAKKLQRSEAQWSEVARNMRDRGNKSNVRYSVHYQELARDRHYELEMVLSDLIHNT